MRRKGQKSPFAPVRLFYAEQVGQRGGHSIHRPAGGAAGIDQSRILGRGATEDQGASAVVPVKGECNLQLGVGQPIRAGVAGLAGREIRYLIFEQRIKPLVDSITVGPARDRLAEKPAALLVTLHLKKTLFAMNRDLPDFGAFFMEQAARTQQVGISGQHIQHAAVGRENLRVPLHGRVQRIPQRRGCAQQID